MLEKLQTEIIADEYKSGELAYAIKNFIENDQI